jgi:PDZ domain
VTGRAISKRVLESLRRPGALTVATVVTLCCASSLQAQQPSYVVPIEMKNQTLVGSAWTDKHENDGTIGITSGSPTDAGFKVNAMLSGSPAVTAGILPGDMIVSVDDLNAFGLNASALNSIARKRDGETADLVIIRNGERKEIGVTVKSRKRVYGNDPDWKKASTAPPGVCQFIFSGTARVTAALSEFEQQPNEAFLQISIVSKDPLPFVVDDKKFFVIDGMGQQLRHVSLEEIKYGIQLSVTQNWKGTNYPPPPSSPQYTISGVENGNYTITSLGGGMASVSGTSNTTYTVTQQPDYNQIGYSIGIALRRLIDAKSNQKTLQQAKELIATWERLDFNSQSPVVSGETRSGEIMYTGSHAMPQGPFRVVLFLTDPRTQKEEHVTFAFGPGAERIKEEMEIKTAAPTTELRKPASLTNADIKGMIKAGIGAEIIIAKIKATSCSFDTSPSALKELKNEGVPDNVVLVMVTR